MSCFEKEISPMTPEDSTSQSDGTQCNLSEFEDLEACGLEGARIAPQKENNKTPKEKIRRVIVCDFEPNIDQSDLKEESKQQESRNRNLDQPWPRDRWNSDITPRERSGVGRNYRHRGSSRRPTNQNRPRSGGRNENNQVYKPDDYRKLPADTRKTMVHSETRVVTEVNKADILSTKLENLENKHDPAIDDLIEKYKDLFKNPKNKCNVTVTDITVSNASNNSPVLQQRRSVHSIRDPVEQDARASSTHRETNNRAIIDSSNREPIRHDVYSRGHREQSFRTSRYHRGAPNRQMMSNATRFHQPYYARPRYPQSYQPETSYYQDMVYQNPPYPMNYESQIPSGYGYNFPAYYQPDQYVHGSQYIPSIPPYDQQLYMMDNIYQQNFPPDVQPTYYIPPNVGYMPMYYDGNHNMKK